MTRYIRTKDGVYEFDYINEKNLNSNVIDIYNCLGLETQIRKCDIIKQSSNLVELCDVYVMISEDYDLPQLVCKMNFDYVKNQCKYKAIYGAIWTSKGLIYVVKMDEEGKLVLICS